MKINFRHNSFFIKIADTSYFLELVFKLILLLNNWHHFFLSAFSEALQAKSGIMFSFFSSKQGKNGSQ